MSSFHSNIRQHVHGELAAATQAQAAGRSREAFIHLERAHVLGQASTMHHVHVHWRMLQWGWRQRSVRECVGQVLRILGAATKTAVGLVPHGNTGGADVSPFRRMPVPGDLALRIREARSRG